ncbi:MAG: LUD domain-containing protein [Planctomycetia bacterium]|nr:LUD domain-containing protein [Planctomycetia bacterium]
MDSRTQILNKIKSALADVDKSKLVEPDMPTVWERTDASHDALVETFANNLRSVAGEAVVCASEEDAIAKITQTLQELAGSDATRQLGVYDSPAIAAILPQLRNALNDWTFMETPSDPAVDPKTYEPLTASLVSPLLLLADTGSCAIEGRCAFERLLCYLSPVCLVLARASQLREHLPHAWGEISGKFIGTDQPGEIALVTGPSRTADIEKKLVLGVHGPRRLIVFLIQD